MFIITRYGKKSNFGCKFDVFGIYVYMHQSFGPGGYGRRIGDSCSLVKFLFKAIKLQKFKFVTPKSHCECWRPWVGIYIGKGSLNSEQQE